MKSNLIEISLSELRLFIDTMDKNYSMQLNQVSLISLKLRLQFIISKNQLNDFGTFFNRVSQDEVFRIHLFSTIKATPNEIFRDAEFWDYFSKDILRISEDSKISICVFESGNFSDTVSLLICLQKYNLFEKCNVTIVDLVERIAPVKAFIFDAKEMEMAILNFSIFEQEIPLLSYFNKKEKDYEFVIPKLVELNQISFEKFKNLTLAYNAVIARNLTLNYNFTAHENLFELYFNKLESSGILFTGNKESFKWCKNFESFTFKNKTIPLYYKK